MLVHKKYDEAKDFFTVWFSSQNIPKAVYYPKNKTLMVYFIRERKSKDIVSESKDLKKLLDKDRGVFLEGAIYNMINIDAETFEEFINAESQGNFWNTKIVKNPKYIKNGNFEMFGYEITELLKERMDREKGFAF